MKIRFYNARIFTMEKDCTLLQGELWTEDDHITYVGIPKRTQTEWDREIDCENNLLMPGFKNAHTHTAMVFLRSYADDLPLQEWLYKKVFPMEERLTAQDIYRMTELGIMEYLSSGITAAYDMYFHCEEIARASIETGFRMVLSGICGSLSASEAEFKEFNSLHPLVSYRFGLHAEYTTKRELIEGMADLASRYKQPVGIHLSETQKEVEECKERYGLSPVQFLASVGLFDFGGSGFHGVWMDERDREVCREKNISIVTNPGSNLKLASGIADLISMRDCGINIGIGTDGAASNNALDFFREMYLVSMLQKIKREDASVMEAGQVLEMASDGGAKAMGLQNCDVLAAGKQADLIMIDLKQPNMQPENNIVKNIVYSGSKTNVKMTMIAGKILYENGQYFIGVEPEEIYRKARESMKRLLAGK